MGLGVLGVLWALWVLGRLGVFVVLLAQAGIQVAVAGKGYRGECKS